MSRWTIGRAIDITERPWYIVYHDGQKVASLVFPPEWEADSAWEHNSEVQARWMPGLAGGRPALLLSGAEVPDELAAAWISPHCGKWDLIAGLSFPGLTWEGDKYLYHLPDLPDPMPPCPVDDWGASPWTTVKAFGYLREVLAIPVHKYVGPGLLLYPTPEIVQAFADRDGRPRAVVEMEIQGEPIAADMTDVLYPGVCVFVAPEQVQGARSAKIERVFRPSVKH